MPLESLNNFSNLHDSFQFNVIWHRLHALIFSLMQGGIDEPWPHLSCVAV